MTILNEDILCIGWLHFWSLLRPFGDCYRYHPSHLDVITRRKKRWNQGVLLMMFETSITSIWNRPNGKQNGNRSKEVEEGYGRVNND